MRCSTRQLESLGVVLAMLLLAACSHAQQPRLKLTAASIDHSIPTAMLHVDLQFRPSAVQLDALQQGVPLTLHMRIAGRQEALAQSITLTLRYFPLSRRYQLRIMPGSDSSYALRGYLFDALERLRIPLVHDPCDTSAPCHVEVGLDYAALPGALRLPALLRPAWRVPDARMLIRGSDA